ncbi:hypothetical protein BY458DRAFT_529681 [Sporodiniella umbellata]|nr:hypothetical protein BY458DRAFT_529681 [Sporodiniella umbellata]
MAGAPTIRQKNNLYKNRAIHHKVPTKTNEAKVIKKPSYSYWIVALFAFVLFGGIILQIIDLFF